MYVDSTRWCRFRLQLADSAPSLRIPLTTCGNNLQFAESIYSCGFYDSLSFWNTYIITSFWILRTIPDSVNFVAESTKFDVDSTKSPVFRVILINTAIQLFVRGIKKQLGRSKKISNVAISATMLYGQFSKESAYNSQIAQFGLVMMFFQKL